MHQFSRKLCETLTASLTSKRLWMAAVALFVEYRDYWANVKMLYSLNGEQIAAFISLNQQHRILFGSIVLFYLGVQTMKNSVFSSAAQAVTATASSLVHETREDIQRIVAEYAERRKDDPSYAPIRPDTEEPFR